MDEPQLERAPLEEVDQARRLVDGGRVEHLDWFRQPLRKLMVLVVAKVLYTAPITVLGLLSRFFASGLPGDRNALQVVVLTHVICVRLKMGISNAILSFPVAARRRQNTATGEPESVFGGGCGLVGR